MWGKRRRLLRNGLDDELRNVESEMEAVREDGDLTSSTGCTPRPEMIPVPDSPSLSVQLPTKQPSKPNLHPPDSSSERTCELPQVPRADGAQYEDLSWGQLHDRCSQRGRRKKASKAVLNARLSTMDAAEVKRN